MKERKSYKTIWNHEVDDPIENDNSIAEAIFRHAKHEYEKAIEIDNAFGEAAQEILKDVPKENLPEGKIFYMDSAYQRNSADSANSDDAGSDDAGSDDASSDDANPSCDQQCNIKEDLTQDEFYYVPDELWPEKVEPVHNKVNYLWYRLTEWKDVEAVNQSNKELMDKCIEFYKKKRPEIEDPLKDDEFWLKCVGDNLISNSIENRDYIYEGDYDCNSNDFKKALKQYDVVIQETLGGFVCHPFVVYDIQYRNCYKAEVDFDDYGKEVLKPYKEKLDKKTWEHGVYQEYSKKRLELIKEGHAIYTVIPHGTEYRMNIRWIDRSNKKTPQPYGELHKDVW